MLHRGQLSLVRVKKSVRCLNNSAKPLRIERIMAYQVDLPLHNGGSYKWANGKSIEVFDATVVIIITNCGIEGYGMYYL